MKAYRYILERNGIGVGVYSWEQRRSKILCQWYEGKYTGKKTRNKVYTDHWGKEYIVKNDIRFYKEDFRRVEAEGG